MSPAFSSTRQAAAFALLLLGIFLLPAVLGKSSLPPREQIYSATPWATGAFPYMDEQFFKEKDDIDIAFMGSSRMWWAMDTPWVQAQLCEKLGRPAVVRSFCWNWAGFDPLYFMMQDLLEHRKVKVIVFNDCSDRSQDIAHTAAPYWFRYGDNAEALAGLGTTSRISFYSSAILGLPRNVVELLRTNGPILPEEELPWGWKPAGFTNLPNLANPSTRLGSAGLSAKSGRPIPAYRPEPGALPEDVCVYSDATRQNFEFQRVALPSMQAEFLRKIADLARRHQVRLVFLHLPMADDLNEKVLREPAFWPDLMGADLPMVGVPPPKLFAGMNEERVPGLFWNFDHLNSNGQLYFTQLVTADLLRIYEDQTKH